MQPGIEAIIDQARAEAKRTSSDVLVGHVILAANRLGDLNEIDIKKVRASLESSSNADPFKAPATELLALAESVRLTEFVLALRSVYDSGHGPATEEVTEPATVEISNEPTDDSKLLEIAFGSLAEKLNSMVIGQEESIHRLVDRLTLTRRGLDLRPDRPDGVFLLLGPTGVGKTHLARSLAHSLFGSDEALIRLDMSEYSEPWAQSRLTGSNPGYVGYTEPSAWLTTRILGNPRAVLLLDEVEKAHPSIWQTFLQVFDAGRLTCLLYTSPSPRD